MIRVAVHGLDSIVALALYVAASQARSPANAVKGLGFRVVDPTSDPSTPDPNP